MTRSLRQPEPYYLQRSLHTDLTMSTHITDNALRETDPDPITGEPGRQRGGQGPEGTHHINPDPITGEPGSHPVATAVGAAGIAAAGAAIGTIAGPIGAVVGGVLGAVVGAAGGSAVGEEMSPTAEDAYWRAHHAQQKYALPNDLYEDYQPAYRVAYEGYSSLGGSERTFEEVEERLRREYERETPRLGWEKSRYAAEAAWKRLGGRERVDPSLDIPPNPIQATAPQAAEVPMSTPSRRS
jgi:hypothetical protein